MKNNTNYAKESFLFGTATFIGTMVIFLLLVFAIVPSACAESVSTAHASVSNINAEGTFEVSPVFHKKDDFPECSNDSVTHGTETPEDKNVVQELFDMSQKVLFYKAFGDLQKSNLLDFSRRTV